jgi:hypothetical protein
MVGTYSPPENFSGGEYSPPKNSCGGEIPPLKILQGGNFLHIFDESKTLWFNFQTFLNNQLILLKIFNFGFACGAETNLIYGH